MVFWSVAGVFKGSTPQGKYPRRCDTYQKVSETGALRASARGSRPNDGCNQRNVLGSKIKMSCKESDEELLGM